MAAISVLQRQSRENQSGYQYYKDSVGGIRQNSSTTIDRSAEVVTRVKKEELSVYDVMGKLTVESRHRLAEAKRLISNQNNFAFEVERRDIDYTDLISLSTKLLTIFILIALLVVRCRCRW